jgi:hypothetical protein
MKNVLSSQNQAWGFWGTLSGAGLDPAEHWVHASTVLAARYAINQVQVRDFLDSRTGRHLADAVADGSPVESVVTRWDKSVRRVITEMYGDAVKLPQAGTQAAVRQIARDHGLDESSAAVQAALEAAYAAGKKAA